MPILKIADSARHIIYAYSKLRDFRAPHSNQRVVGLTLAQRAAEVCNTDAWYINYEIGVLHRHFRVQIRVGLGLVAHPIVFDQLVDQLARLARLALGILPKKQTIARFTGFIA